MSKNIIALTFILLFTACENKSDETPVEIDLEYFKAFEINGPISQTIVKTAEGLIYFISESIYEYNYVNQELMAEYSTSSNFSGRTIDIGLDENGNKEIYTLYDNSFIRIYTLDNMSLVREIDIRPLAMNDITLSAAYSTPNLFFFGINDISKSFDESLLAINKNTEQVLSKSTFGDSNMKLKSFKLDTEGNICVLGLRFGGTTPVLFLYIFDSSGQLLLESGGGEIRSNGKAIVMSATDYGKTFIVGDRVYTIQLRDGDTPLIRAFDSEYLKESIYERSIPGTNSFYTISEGGQFLDPVLSVYSKNDTFTKRHILKSTANNGFVTSDEKLVLAYYNRSNGITEVHMSILNEKDLD